MTNKPVRRARPAASPRRAADGPPLRRTVRIPDPPEIDPVVVHGLYVDAVTVIPKTTAVLHIVPGTLRRDNEENHSVLVPFTEVRLGGLPLDEASGAEAEDDLPTVFSQNLPLENFAFVLLDLTSDLRRMCREISELSQGTLTVDPARMAVLRYFVAHLENQARSCRVILDKTYGTPEATEL